jgi:hypothetical protein
MAYGIYRSDNVSATKDGSQIKSVLFYAGANDGVLTAIENGNIVKITNTRVTGEREIYKAVTPAAADTVNTLGIVTSPEVLYDEHKKNLGEFRNEAGVPARVFLFNNGGEFSVTADCLTGTPALGSAVTVAASTKMAVIAVASLASENVIGYITATETIGGTTYWTIKVQY